MAVARGIALAHRDGDMPAGYADALAKDEQDIEEVEFRVNADRKWDSAVDKMGRR